MLQRVVYGLLAIAIVVALFVLDLMAAVCAEGIAGPIGRLLRNGSVLPAVFVLIYTAGAHEMNRLLRLRGIRPHAWFAYSAVCLLILSPWLSTAGCLGQGAAQVEGIYWQIVWLIGAIIGVGVLSVLRREPTGSLQDSGATVLVIMYLGFLPSFGMQLRCGPDVPGQAGVWLLLMVILVTKSSDIGAYFVGSLFGHHKLKPSVSPAKSIEGALGGVAGSILATAALIAACLAVIRLASPENEQLTAQLNMLGFRQTLMFLAEPSEPFPIFRIVLFGASMSVVGQVGDLVESSFKRDAGVKDSGRIMPRFGGILDLVDSPVFTMPVGWFLLTAVWS